MKLYLGPDSDEAFGQTIKKRKQEKKKLLDYCREKILISQTHADLPYVIINISCLSGHLTNKDDCGLIVTTTAKYKSSNIKNYCNKLPPLNCSPTIEELIKDERMPPTSGFISEEFIKVQETHSFGENK